MTLPRTASGTSARAGQLGLIAEVALVLIGLLAWRILVSEPVALIAYSVVDIVLFALLMTRRVIRNEFAMLFGMLGLVYAYSFAFEALIGLTDPESLTMVINLTARGMDLVQDSAAAVLASILFRNAIILGWWPQVGRSTRMGHTIALIKTEDVALIFLIAIAAYIVGSATGISTMLLLAGDLSISLAAMVCVVVTRQFDFRLVPMMVVIFVAAVVLLFVSRSRLPIMVSALILAVVYFSRARIQPVRLSLVGVAILAVFMLFGQLRDAVWSGGESGGAAAEQTGVLSQEESGIVQLIDAHVIGLASRGEVPGELQETLLDKLIRAVPGAGSPMLAERYVWSFFPEIASGGGGFAYPEVAEWFVFAGALGVVLAGAVIGFLIGTLTMHVSSGYATAVTIVFFAQFQRQELSASLLTIVALILGSSALQLARYLLVAARRPAGGPSPAAGA